jgi:hypothetical protein
MTKRLTAAQLTRRATLARAREVAIAARVPSTATTVRKQPRRKFVYNSYSFTGTGGASSLFGVQVSDKALNYLTSGTDPEILSKLGLRRPGTVTDPVGRAPKGFQPAKVSIMVASATPTPRNTPWGTRVIRYNTPTTGTSQAFYTSPICSDTTATYPEVNDKATALYVALLAASKLGDPDYGRFYVTPEGFTDSKN